MVWQAMRRVPAYRVGTLGLVDVALLVVFTIANPNFALPTNALGLLRATSSLAIIALGQTLVLVVGELDLSVGSTYGSRSYLLAVMWVGWGLSFFLALPIALVVALGIGAWNAFLTTVVRIPSFIATLGTLSILEGLTLYVGKAANFNPLYAAVPIDPIETDMFHALAGADLPLKIPPQILWLAIISIVVGILLHGSLFGFRLAAIGGNVQAATFAKLPVRRYKFAVFMSCSLLAALAGILDFSFIGSTQPGTGALLTFPVFAAVVIGGASLAGGRGSVIGTLCGVLMLAILANGLAVVGVGAYAQLILVGGVTIAAVALDRWRKESV